VDRSARRADVQAFELGALDALSRQLLQTRKRRDLLRLRQRQISLGLLEPALGHDRVRHR
jgi:hypothetical protein